MGNLSILTTNYEICTIICLNELIYVKYLAQCLVYAST